MADVLEDAELGLRLIYGRPEVVEAWIEQHKTQYIVSSLFYYVTDNQLGVAATCIHQREIRKQQLAMLNMPPNQRRQ